MERNGSTHQGTCKSSSVAKIEKVWTERNEAREGRRDEVTKPRDRHQRILSNRLAFQKDYPVGT